MNYIWIVIIFLLLLAGFGYSLWHIWNILPFPLLFKGIGVGILALCFLVMFFNFFVGLDRLPMVLSEILYEVGFSSIFIMLYLVILFAVLDLGKVCHIFPRSLLYNSVGGSIFIFIIIFGLFFYGNLHYNKKYRQPIALVTSKKLNKPLKIVMLSDLHLGYHNRKSEFRRWVNLINKETPDLILIGGDIVDGSIRALREQKMDKEFLRLRAPVYACLGNHEYYSGESEARQFYKDAKIHLLVDSVVETDGINIIGRDDRTNMHRASLAQLCARVKDKTLYTILLDHQPYHLEEAEESHIDFQLSGHTHYGQVWPISWIENAIYEDAYGPFKKGRTQYFVTSGIGIWGGKFRIGTRSEYLVVTLSHQ